MNSIQHVDGGVSTFSLLHPTCGTVPIPLREAEWGTREASETIQKKLKTSLTCSQKIRFVETVPMMCVCVCVCDMCVRACVSALSLLLQHGHTRTLQIVVIINRHIFTQPLHQ